MTTFLDTWTLRVADSGKLQLNFLSRLCGPASKEQLLRHSYMLVRLSSAASQLRDSRTTILNSSKAQLNL